MAAVGPAQGCPRAVCQRRTKMLLSPACRSAKCCQRMLHRMQRRTSSSRLRRDASREERGWLVRRPLIGFPDRGSARRVVMRPSSGGRVDRSLSVRSSRARLSEQADAGKLLSLRERTCRHGGPLECATFLASKVLHVAALVLSCHTNSPRCDSSYAAMPVIKERPPLPGPSHSLEVSLSLGSVLMAVCPYHANQAEHFTPMLAGDRGESPTCCHAGPACAERQGGR